MLRPVLEEGGSAKRPAECDLGRSFNQSLKKVVPFREFQPELGEGGSALRPAGLNLWPALQPELGEGGFAKEPAEVDL